MRSIFNHKYKIILYSHFLFSFFLNGQSINIVAIFISLSENYGTMLAFSRVARFNRKYVCSLIQLYSYSKQSRGVANTHAHFQIFPVHFSASTILLNINLFDIPEWKFHESYLKCKKWNIFPLIGQHTSFEFLAQYCILGCGRCLSYSCWYAWLSSCQFDIMPTRTE